MISWAAHFAHGVARRWLRGRSVMVACRRPSHGSGLVDGRFCTSKTRYSSLTLFKAMRCSKWIAGWSMNAQKLRTLHGQTLRTPYYFRIKRCVINCPEPAWRVESFLITTPLKQNVLASFSPHDNDWFYDDIKQMLDTNRGSPRKLSNKFYLIEHWLPICFTAASICTKLWHAVCVKCNKLLMKQRCGISPDETLRVTG